MSQQSYEGDSVPVEIQYSTAPCTASQFSYDPTLDKSIKQSIQVMEKKIHIAYRSLQKEIDEQV